MAYSDVKFLRDVRKGERYHYWWPMVIRKQPKTEPLHYFFGSKER